jgi:hypothetical protein
MTTGVIIAIGVAMLIAVAVAVFLLLPRSRRQALASEPARFNREEPGTETAASEHRDATSRF